MVILEDSVKSLLHCVPFGTATPFLTLYHFALDWWAWSNLRRKSNGYRENREVRTPYLFVPDIVGQILQRTVRSNGKNAGHWLLVRTRWMQGQNALTIAWPPL